jgi:hypothetical protein
LPDEDFQTPADVSQAFGALPDEAQGAQEGKHAHRPSKGPQMRASAGLSRK